MNLLIALLALLCALAVPGDVHAVAGLGPLLPIPQKTAAATPPIVGYSLWLNAPYSGNNNTTWVDQSGNGRNATITNSGATWALTSSGINGLPSYMGVNGSNGSYARTAAYTVGPAVTVFVAYQLFSGGATTNRGGLVDATYSSGYAVMTSFGGSGDHGVYGYIAGNAPGLISGTQDTNPHVAAVVYPDPSVTNQVTWYLDGTVFITNSSATAPSGSTTRQIGNWAVLGNTIQGMIGEVIEYPFAMTSVQMSATNAYLVAKWL
jgi:hypothetical protein